MEEKTYTPMTQNLDVLDKIDNFTNWVYQEIRPFITGNIFEIGSGRGTYSKKIIKDFTGNKIILSDIDQNYIKELGQFENKDVSILKVDISCKEDFRNIKIPIDSAFALNVLEHIEDDVHAMNNIYDSLRIGGKFIILVPAHKFLFNCIDSSVGHCRRYTKNEIIAKVSKTKFKIKNLFYFNFLSIFGWYLNGHVFKKNVINKSAACILDKLIPLLRIIEQYILRKRIGISIIVVLQK